MASRSKGVKAPGAVPPKWQPVTGTAPRRRLVNASRTGALHHSYGSTAPLLYCYCGDRQARGSVRTAGRLLPLRQHWALLRYTATSASGALGWLARGEDSHPPGGFLNFLNKNIPVHAQGVSDGSSFKLIDVGNDTNVANCGRTRMLWTKNEDCRLVHASRHGSCSSSQGVTPPAPKLLRASAALPFLPCERRRASRRPNPGSGLAQGRRAEAWTGRRRRGGPRGGCGGPLPAEEQAYARAILAVARELARALCSSTGRRSRSLVGGVSSLPF
ncbi:hypothetical protein C2845_PM13G20720 [Panicum miliaceum]|uniref:Uncharacterized protein n=1 Tax=Panicum miliaceum TaxID=4540 RepID=A0A3L6RJL8_PANMI|nr:hypothetical protein C2845_PM13G20720 [Panicum miliaceum]